MARGAAVRESRADNAVYFDAADCVAKCRPLPDANREFALK
jgi:hypothetical protein